MAAVLLACVSAVLFGSLSVALRRALARVPDAEAGALVTSLVGLVACGAIAVATLDFRGDVVPFLLAGVIAPGGSQILYVLAVRDCGPARASVIVGVAPLVSVAIALSFLDEPLRLPLVVGALLIVAGGVALAGERIRPAEFRGLGVAFALAATVLFATRDNIVRALSDETEVAPQVAASATMVASIAVISAFLLLGPRRREFAGRVRRAAIPFALSGLCFGLSYAALFEAYYRGRVTVVSPLVATESLWGVLAAVVVLRASEAVGRHVALGALLIVAGGVLIGASR